MESRNDDGCIACVTTNDLFVIVRNYKFTENHPSSKSLDRGEARGRFMGLELILLWVKICAEMINDNLAERILLIVFCIGYSLEIISGSDPTKTSLSEMR